MILMYFDIIRLPHATFRSDMTLKDSLVYQTFYIFIYKQPFTFVYG